MIAQYLFNHKINKILLFLISGTTVCYAAGKYLKHPIFFFSYEIDGEEDRKFSNIFTFVA